MRSIQSVIFSNSLAIVLTIICVLPITAVFVFSLTAPVDDAFAKFGLWLHNSYGWTVSTFVTELRFAKIGFALRSVVIALFISFLYYWISNWLNFGLAKLDPISQLPKDLLLLKRYNLGYSLDQHSYCYCYFYLYQR